MNTPAAPSFASIWLQALRPRTLPAAAVPVAVGAALAQHDGALHIPTTLCALASALMIQVGTNFANDYYDAVKGADTDARLGPTRATAAGLVKPTTMRNAFLLAFGVAALLGCYLVWRGGLPIVVVGLLSIASGILYTGGPAPLGYLGLGELFVLIFFGPVAVGGTYWLNTNQLPWYVLVAGLAPGLLSSAILVVNNLRDRHTDIHAGKNTLAVRFGATFARVEYLLFVVAASLLIPLILWQGAAFSPWILVAVATLFPALVLTRRVFSEEGRILNKRLAQTGMLTVLFGALFCLGALLS